MTDTDILRFSTSPGNAALGFGAMRLPGERAECRKMFDAYLEGGFNYFDTAYVYGDSELVLRDELVLRHARDSFMLASKLPPWKLKNRKDCDKLLGETLTRTGTDYLDFYLIHSIDNGTAQGIEQRGVYPWCAEQKQKGTVRHVGFSFHGSPALLDKTLTEHPEMEFVQLQLNYVDILHGQAGELHDIALKHKKPIIIMEPLKGGTLASLPKAAEELFRAHSPGRSVASWAMRYAASLAGATCILSGMSKHEQVVNNLAAFTPLSLLTDDEKTVIGQVLDELSKVASIPCTSCRYCIESCPQNIEIPVCFSLYNEGMRGSEKWNRKMLYETIPAGRRAGDCIRCGACLSHCPQHIDIPNELPTVAEYFK